MSVSCSAILVAGVFAEDVICEKTEAIVQRKFNEDTGEPYEKKTLTKRRFVGNIDITEARLLDLGKNDEEFFKPYGLSVFRSDWQSFGDAIGVVIAEVKPHKPGFTKRVYSTSISMVLDEATEKLKEIGVELPASLILIQQCL